MEKMGFIGGGLGGGKIIILIRLLFLLTPGAMLSIWNTLSHLILQQPWETVIFLFLLLGRSN